MSLTTFDIEKRAQLAAPTEQEVEFEDGIFFTVRFLPRPQLQKIFKESQTQKMNTVTRLREPQTDPAKFAQKFCEQVLTGWRGMTPRKISRLIQLDLSGLTEEELDEEIPFKQDQAVFLIQTAYSVDSFLQDYCQNLNNFKPEKAEEEKNS